MHLLTATKPLTMGPNYALQPGTYLCEDLDAAQLMLMVGGGEVRMQSFHDCLATLAELPDDFDGKITVIRPGRYGDLILLTPCFREIKRRWPNCTLQVACLPGYRDAIMGLPYIDNYLAYPLPIEEDNNDFGHLVSLEVLTSLTTREGELHMTDLFAERLGLTAIADKKPDFFLSLEERTWAHDVYPRGKAKRVAVQIKSSTPSRNYPTIQMGAVMRMLHGRGWDLVLLGLPNEVNGKSEERIVNCAADKLTFRQSAAVLATADVFLGPDSSLIHVAGALGTPAIGIFSVVPWQLRTAYCPTTFVIQAKKGCDIAPCFHAPRGQMGFPANGPCQKERKCCALDSIDPHEVVGRVEQAANSLLHERP